MGMMSCILSGPEFMVSGGCSSLYSDPAAVPGWLDGLIFLFTIRNVFMMHSPALSTEAGSQDEPRVPSGQ